MKRDHVSKIEIIYRYLTLFFESKSLRSFGIQGHICSTDGHRGSAKKYSLKDIQRGGLQQLNESLTFKAATNKIHGKKETLEKLFNNFCLFFPVSG